MDFFLHSRESGNPWAGAVLLLWVPAFAGMTV
jgi:hypothetical protein